MDRYRKLFVAALGAVLQLLAVLDGASAAGVLPDSWVPVVQVLVGIATTFGVWRVPNRTVLAVVSHDGRHEAPSGGAG